MYRVPQAFGDYIPLIGVISLLAFDLMRSLEKRLAPAEIAVCCVPLPCTFWAIVNKSIIAQLAVSPELLWYPPVMLGVIGGVILWLSLHHRRHELIYVAILYGLGSLLSIGFSADKPYELNWHLAGGGIVALLFVLGVLRRNVFLCFGAVIVLSVGAGTSELFAIIAKSVDLTVCGAAAGVAGEDPRRDRHVGARRVGEDLELRVGGEGVAHRLRRIGPLQSGIEALGVLPEDHRIHLRLVHAAVGRTPDEVQRIAREGSAGPDADVQVEALAQADDGAEVDVALVAKLGLELQRGLVLRFRGDRAEEAQLVLGQ